LTSSKSGALSLSLAPWAQCPLVSTTYFTRWVHFFLSIANLYRVQMSLLHQSARSSVHLLLGLPLLFLPSIIPKMTCFICLSFASCMCDRRRPFHKSDWRNWGSVASSPSSVWGKAAVTVDWGHAREANLRMNMLEKWLLNYTKWTT